MKIKFLECVEYMIKGPFGSDMKKSLYVSKGEDTYKVYVQGNAIQKDENMGDYYVSSEYFHKKLERFQVHPGDYIITCDGTLGKYIKLSENIEPGVISSSLLLLRLDESKIYDKFFELIWDNSMLKYLASQARNACLVHLPSAKAIGDVEIDLPEMSIQQGIADKVFLIKDIIKNRNEEIGLLDDLIKARFVELFGDGRDGKTPVKMLDSICKFQQGTQIPVDEQFEEQKDGYKRFLRIIDYTQAPQPPRYVNVNGKEVDEKSVVIVRYGATAGFVGRGYQGILANNLFEIMPDETILSKDFLFLALKYGTFEKEVHDKAFGAAMPALSFSMMNDIPVVVPVAEQQQQFVSFVEQTDKSKVAVQKSLEETQLLFHSLMQKYFG